METYLNSYITCASSCCCSSTRLIFETPALFRQWITFSLLSYGPHSFLVTCFIRGAARRDRGRYFERCVNKAECPMTFILRPINLRPCAGSRSRDWSVLIATAWSPSQNRTYAKLNALLRMACYQWYWLFPHARVRYIVASNPLQA